MVKTLEFMERNEKVITGSEECQWHYKNQHNWYYLSDGRTYSRIKEWISGNGSSPMISLLHKNDIFRKIIIESDSCEMAKELVAA